MKHSELTEGMNLVSDEMHDPEEDKTVISLDDTRKPILLLKDINRLRKMREIGKFQNQKDLETLELLYGQSDSEE